MPMPLSPEQLLIRRQQGDSSHAIRNIPISARLFGLADNEAMTAAIRDLIGRHAILRTVFTESDGVPVQEVLDVAAAPELEIKQVSEQAMAQVFNSAADHEFDLRSETPMRAHLFLNDQGLRTLLFVFHRIAFDNCSVNPLMNDLFAFYSARVEGREPDMPTLSMQYADYARSRCGTSEKIAFSEKTPESGPSETESHGIVSIRLNPGFHGRLLAFSKEADVPIASILYAGFAVFLARLGLGDKAVFSILHSERSRFPELSMLIGNFETVLPLEISTRNNPSFREVVGCAARSYEAACEHQHQSDNYQNNETGGNAIRFRTLFRLKPAGVETFKYPVLNVHVNPVPVTETGFELVFDLMERIAPDGKPQGIEGSVIFDRNVFAPDME